MEKLTIFGTLPNLNDYQRADRTNKYVGAKMKRDAEEIITAYIMQQLRGVSFKKKVRLEFSWYEPNRKRDLDNICFAKKFILDALVSNKVIKTDGWQGVECFTDKFYIDKNNPRIEVVISEVENER